jgi:CRP/FNR family cyclic AMP-dependent transcriptional regulator
MRKALYILGELNDHDVEWIIENGHRENFSTGSILIEKDRPIDALYIMLEGEVVVVLEAKGVEIVRLGAGEIIGEISFVDERPPSATVKAASSGSVLIIPRSALRAKLLEDEGFASRFYRALAIFLAHRLRRTSLFGYAGAHALQEGEADSDELGEEVLDNVYLAGARFQTILERASGSG